MIPDPRARIDGRPVRANRKHKPRIAMLAPAHPPNTRTQHPHLEADVPRYYAQQLPHSDRWSIYDTDQIGEVCSCLSIRLVGLLAALNGQAKREKLCKL